MCGHSRAQVRLLGFGIFRLLQQKLAWLTRQADLDGDGSASTGFSNPRSRAHAIVLFPRAVRARIQPDPGGPVLTLLRLCSRLILPAVNLDDSRIAYSKIAPFVKQHTALTGGAVAGFVVAYSGLR